MLSGQISTCIQDPIRETNFQLVRKLIQVKIPDEELQKATLQDGLDIQVIATKPFTVSTFWIVKIQDIHSEIEKDWITMRDLLWQDKFLVKRDAQSPHEPCLYRNQPQIFYQTNELVNVKIRPPIPIDTSRMPIPRDFYPLIIIVTCHEEEPERNANDVAANIHLIHIKDDVVPIKSHVIKNYTKQVDGKILDISRLYAEDSKACMICFEEADPNVGLRLFCLLPCRHSHICSDCIRRIRECPKCRSFIASVFDVNGSIIPQNTANEPTEQEATSANDDPRDRGPRRSGGFMASLKSLFGM